MYIYIYIYIYGTYMYIKPLSRELEPAKFQKQSSGEQSGIHGRPALYWHRARDVAAQQRFRV